MTAPSGPELMQARQDLDLSRQQVRSALGWPSGKLAPIEQGKRDPSSQEVKQLLELYDRLRSAGPEPEADARHQPISELDKIRLEAPGRSLTWKGPDGHLLQAGDTFRVKGERGRFKFLYHYQDEKQEYIEAWGPPSRPKERSLYPDRVIIKTARRKRSTSK